MTSPISARFKLYFLKNIDILPIMCYTIIEQKGRVCYEISFSRRNGKKMGYI